MINQDNTDLCDPTQQLSIATENDSQDGQITAEVVQADLPSPGKTLNFTLKISFYLSSSNLFFFSYLGGTRRVVLLLPDGNFMMTEVSDEQYQSLNLVT